MTGDPLERLARRQTVRRALAFVGISTAIVLSVVARALHRATAHAGPQQPRPCQAGRWQCRRSPAVVRTVRGGSPAPATTPRKKHAHHPATAGSATTAPRTTPAPTHSRAPRTTAPPAPATHTSSPAPTPDDAHRPAPAQTTTRPAQTTQRVVTGSAYDVGYGIVQVRVTVRGSTILDVTAVSLPEGGHSGDISAMAEPQLRREAISAQSAHINAVSGATYTSAGYAKSLQSALDKAAA